MSVLWLIPVVADSWDFFPTKHQIMRSWAFETRRMVSEAIRQDAQGRYSPKLLPFYRRYQDLPPQEFIQQTQEIYSKQETIDFSSINQRFETELNRLLGKQAKIVGIAFGVWLSPLIAIYGLGLAGGRVYRSTVVAGLVPCIRVSIKTALLMLGAFGAVAVLILIGFVYYFEFFFSFVSL
ncbi:MAG: hypothetical protein ACE5MM_06970 [Nitrospiraceae bacterium]